MKLLLQRVKKAQVIVEEKTVGEIGHGLLIFAAFEAGDDETLIEPLLNKALLYRVFPDGENKMNLNVQQVSGGILFVSQFTLAADTKKGLRPNFSPAAPPQEAKSLYQHAVRYLKNNHRPIATGVFAADMQVELVNDGPVTIWLES